MLVQFRNNFQSFGVKFLLGIIILVFTFWGVGNFGDLRVNVVADVEGNKIFLTEYQNSYESALENARLRYQGNVSPSLANSLKKDVLDRLINQALMVQSAKENAFTVTNAEIANYLYQTEQFQTDGRFDQRKYEQYLKRIRSSKIDYEDQLRNNLLLEKYIGFLTTAISVSPELLKREYVRNETEIDMEVLHFTPSLFMNQVKITDQMIQDYYQANKHRYQLPRRYSLQYFRIVFTDLLEKIQVRDREIEFYYEENKEKEFTTKKQFKSRHILIKVDENAANSVLAKAEKKANQIYQQLIQEPKKFSSLAKKYSGDPISGKKGGSLGWAEYGSFPEGYENVIQTMKKGQISKPFRTSLGYHIAEVLDTKDRMIIPLEEVKEKIIEIKQQQKAQRKLESMRSQYEENLQKNGLTQAAASANKKIVTTEPFEENSVVPGIGMIGELYKQLANHPKGYRGVYKLPEYRGYIFYEIASIIEPSVQPLEKVIHQVQKEVRKQQAEFLLQQKLREYETTIRTKEQFNQVAQNLNVQPQKARFKYRDIIIEGIGYAEHFRDALFSMPEERSVIAISSGPNQYLIWENQKKLPLAEKVNKASFEELEERAKSMKTALLIASVVTDMRRNAQITLNHPLLNNLGIDMSLPVSN